MDIEEMKDLLRSSLQEKRYNHSILVYETALDLAKCHGADIDKAATAALLHDCGREVPVPESLDRARELGIEIDEVEGCQPILLHAKLGVWYAQHKYGVEDREILDAIRYHTTGAKDMSVTAMIVYLADLLEPTRSFPGIDKLRHVAKKDLKKAMFRAYGNTIRYLLEYDLLIHPDAVAGYNQIAAERRRQKRGF